MLVGRSSRPFMLLALVSSTAALSAGRASAAPPNAVVGVAPDVWAARQGTALGFLAKRSGPGACESVRITVDGKSRVATNAAFPYAFQIAPGDPLYPARSGKIDVVVEGLTPACPGRAATAFMFDATPKPTKPATGAGAPGAGAGAAASAGAAIPVAPSPPSVSGKLASMLVPDGSFAEDDPQKLRVQGAGACRLDLTIARVDAGAPGAKSWSVGPVALDAGAMLFNGTHFDTLAEGSYSAKAVGKDGCSGTAAIDFKVTPKTTQKLVKGQPTLSLDKAPLAGPAFRRSKDSNILFAVKLPQSVLDEPSAGCCEIEYGFKNPYGAWEVYGGSPTQDSSFGGATKQGSTVVFKSISGFKEGTQWRAHVRAFKYKTAFEWSDWLEFQVDQN